MTLTLTLEQVFMIVAGTAAIGGIIWRVRPYVQGEVEKAVQPLRSEMHEWRAGSSARHERTQHTLDEILDGLRPLKVEVQQNTRGNEAGKAGIVRLSDAAASLDKRVHEVELHTGLRKLGAAALEFHDTGAPGA